MPRLFYFRKHQSEVSTAMLLQQAFADIAFPARLELAFLA